MEGLLETLGLAGHRDKFPSQLFGGQQQRCAIARALIKNPKLLLCDEPTGALDSGTSRDILILLEEINRWQALPQKHGLAVGKTKQVGKHPKPGAITQCAMHVLLVDVPVNQQPDFF